MTMPQEIREKIASLALKTVRNGATESEEQSARAMILRLKEKYDTETKVVKNQYIQQPYVSIQHYNWKKIAKDYLSPSNFKIFEKTNQMTQDLVDKISWDHVAAEHLVSKNFISYLDQTDPIWNNLKKRTDKLSATLEYRRKAYEIFMSFGR